MYTIGDRFDHMIMDSSTYGGVAADSPPQGYRTPPVDWATRMSYSGIFFHSAPWSLGDQGVRNVSHGCLNLSPANAKWIFDNTKRGDIVVVRNTVGGILEGDRGSRRLEHSLGDVEGRQRQYLTGLVDRGFERRRATGLRSPSVVVEVVQGRGPGGGRCIARRRC